MSFSTTFAQLARNATMANAQARAQGAEAWGTAIRHLSQLPFQIYNLQQQEKDREVRREYNEIQRAFTDQRRQQMADQQEVEEIAGTIVRERGGDIGAAIDYADQNGALNVASLLREQQAQRLGAAATEHQMHAAEIGRWNGRIQHLTRTGQLNEQTWGQLQRDAPPGLPLPNWSEFEKLPDEERATFGMGERERLAFMASAERRATAAAQGAASAFGVAIPLALTTTDQGEFNEQLGVLGKVNPQLERDLDAFRDLTPEEYDTLRAIARTSQPDDDTRLMDDETLARLALSGDPNDRQTYETLMRLRSEIRGDTQAREDERMATARRAFGTANRMLADVNEFGEPDPMRESAFITAANLAGEAAAGGNRVMPITEVAEFVAAKVAQHEERRANDPYWHTDEAQQLNVGEFLGTEFVMYLDPSDMTYKVEHRHIVEQMRRRGVPFDFMPLSDMYLGAVGNLFDLRPSTDPRPQPVR